MKAWPFALLALITLPVSAQAHEIWVERDGNGPARIYLGEPAEALPEGTPVIGQPDAVADALDRYFARHPEYALGDQGRLRFLTTGSPGGQNERVERFWGEPLTFEKA